MTTPLTHWLPSSRRTSHRPRPTWRPAVESLEDRTTPVLIANQLGAPILPGALTPVTPPSQLVPLPEGLDVGGVSRSDAATSVAVASSTGLVPRPGALSPPGSGTSGSGGGTGGDGSGGTGGDGSGGGHVCPPGSTGSSGGTDGDAAAREKEKVLLFHRTGSRTNPWVLIEVSSNAVSAHLKHGDMLARDVTGLAGIPDNLINDLDRDLLAGAAENAKGNQKVTLCHRTGSETNPWVLITVSVNAMDAHLDNHGDKIASDMDGDGDIDDADCVAQTTVHVCPPGDDGDDGAGGAGGGDDGDDHDGNDHDHGGPEKVLIWHATSSATNPWVLISVSTNAMGAHLDGHGDLLAADLVGGANGGPDGIIDERDLIAQLGGAVGPGGTFTIGGDGELIRLIDRRDIAVIGAGVGGGPLVRVLDADTGVELFHGFAFDSSQRGGVRVAVGDVTGDGWSDIIVGAGPGGGPHVRVFDGLTGVQIGGPLGNFFAFDSSLTGGVSVAAGDVNGDGFADLVATAGAGGGPHVKVFSGKDGSILHSFFAYDSSFTGGVNVAVADVDGDGQADIVTAPASGGGPHVKVFSGTDLALLESFFAYDTSFTGGVFVSAGDLDGDGKAEIVTGAGPGGGAHVKVFGRGGAELASFLAFDEAAAGGVRVAVVDVDADGDGEVVAATGPGRGADVRVFDPLGAGELDSDFGFDSSFRGGVFVA